MLLLTNSVRKIPYLCTEHLEVESYEEPVKAASLWFRQARGHSQFEVPPVTLKDSPVTRLPRPVTHIYSLWVEAGILPAELKSGSSV